MANITVVKFQSTVEEFTATHEAYYRAWNEGFKTGDSEAATRFISPAFIGYYCLKDMARPERADANAYIQGTAHVIRSLGTSTYWDIKDRSFVVRGENEVVVRYVGELHKPEMVEVELFVEVWRRNTEGEFKLVRCYEEIVTPQPTVTDLAAIGQEVREAHRAYYAAFNESFKRRNVAGLDRLLAESFVSHFYSDEISPLEPQVFDKAAYLAGMNGAVLDMDPDLTWGIHDLTVLPHSESEAHISYVGVLAHPEPRGTDTILFLEFWTKVEGQWRLTRSYEEVNCDCFH